MNKEKPDNPRRQFQVRHTQQSWNKGMNYKMSPKKDTKATADKNTKAGKNAPGMAKKQDAKKPAAARPKK